nr:AAA family ATPase [Micromonospora sp. DSM 115978]
MRTRVSVSDAVVEAGHFAAGGNGCGFIGRADELARLTELLVEPTPVQTVVVLDGEPGIGKTRLVGEFAGRTVGPGMPMLSGRAAEFERAVPYGIFLDALAGSPEGDAPHSRQLREMLESGSRVPAGGVGGMQRRELHSRIRALLATMVGPAGLLVLLDDVHWADEASVDLLNLLLRYPPANRVRFLLATMTGQCPPLLEATLARLSPAPARLRLGPLAGTDLASWLAAEPPVRRRLLERISAGNPLYLELLAPLPTADLVALEADDCSQLEARVGLSGTIAAELRGLGTVERRIAQAAAVLGPGRDFVAIAQVAEVPPDLATAAIDRLAGRIVLREANGRLEFRHPLVRAAAYWTAGPAWRAAAHRRAAAHLRERGAPLTLQAHHLARTVDVGDEEGAAILADAARSVLGTAPGSSERWLRSALAALPDRPELAERRSELMLWHAKALSMCGQLDTARAVLHDIVALAGPHRHAAVEHLAVVERLFGRHDTSRALLNRELTLDRSGAAAQALRLELAVNEMLDGVWAEATRHGDEAIRYARLAGDSGVEAAAQTVLAGCALGTSALPTALAHIDRAGRLVDGLADPALRDELGSVALLAWIEHSVDRNLVALRHLQRGIRAARHYGRNHILPQLYTVRAIVRTSLGRVAEALQDAREAEALARRQASSEIAVLAAAVSLRPTLWVDGPEGARTILARLHTVEPPRSAWYRAISLGLIGEATLAVAESGQPDGESPPPVSMAEAVAAARRCLGPGAATALALSVEGAPGVPGGAGRLLRARGVAGGLSSQRGRVELTAARLALAAGRVDEAVACGLRAVGLFVRAGTPAPEGIARMRLAEAYFVTGDATAGRAQVGTAKGLFVAAGARWLAEEAGRAQRRFGARMPRAGLAGRLSGREAEVAELVAQGMTNQQIASRLVVSPRTVESHLARIMSKLNAPTRAAIGRHLGTLPA